VVDLALAISRKIVGSVEPSDAVARIASEAISAFQADANVVLFVSPALQEAIKAKLAQLLAASNSAHPRVDVQPDPNAGHDQAFLATETSSVDLSVPAQLEIVESSLRGAVAGDGK
jgi:flagellar biosynthesis/type III secretory pathway protein FliH